MRKPQKNKIWIYDILGLMALSIAGISYLVPQLNASTPLSENEAEVVASDGIRYEIPVLQNGQPQQIIEHLAYTISYNHNWLIPNWVAYELTDRESDGEQQRSNAFVPDPLVNGDPVVTYDYTKSGYDRGHMAPAGDMKWSEQAMRESFYMTNICPQNHNNNAGDWKSLEELARDWARRYGSIYICCGPVVSDNPSYIGKNHQIAVPSSFYKVFLRRKGNGWTAIGFLMANEAGTHPLMTYIMTVDDIELLTGIDFFPTLSDDIETKVEADYTVSDWNI